MWRMAYPYRSVGTGKMPQNVAVGEWQKAVVRSGGGRRAGSGWGQARGSGAGEAAGGRTAPVSMSSHAYVIDAAKCHPGSSVALATPALGALTGQFNAN